MGVKGQGLENPEGGPISVDGGKNDEVGATWGSHFGI